MTKESDFEASYVSRLKEEFPGSEVIKGNSALRAGIPDRLFIWEDHWAFLEFKKATNATKRQHQEYYVEKFNKMSYASFVNPDNADEVFDEIQSAFRPRG